MKYIRQIFTQNKMLEGIYTCMTYICVKITRIYARTGLRLVHIGFGTSQVKSSLM